jgi:hypothetical protein
MQIISDMVSLESRVEWIAEWVLVKDPQGIGRLREYLTADACRDHSSDGLVSQELTIIDDAVHWLVLEAALQMGFTDLISFDKNATRDDYEPLFVQCRRRAKLAAFR